MIFCKPYLKHTIASVIVLVNSVWLSLSYAQDTNRKSGSTNTVPATVDNKVRNIDGVAAVVNTGYVTRREIDERIAALQKIGRAHV